MKQPYFFGYGSLVNASTHSYTNLHPARLKGWQRSWVQTGLRDLAFLTAAPNPTSEIEGVIAAVPNADWLTLDEREYAYIRQDATLQTRHDHAPATDIQVYAVPEDRQNDTSPPYPVWLSYLDVVVQGYLNLFGEEGVAAFFATTYGWDRPFVDDRSAPRYPRAQILSPQEMSLVDDHLERTPAQRTKL